MRCKVDVGIISQQNELQLKIMK